jgi:hypothetical protein
MGLESYQEPKIRPDQPRPGGFWTRSLAETEERLHLLLVYLQHRDHDFIDENIDLLIGTDQINGHLLAHRV